MKLGQTLAVRPDLVGKRLAEVLSSFQDQLKPFSTRRVRKALKEEFSTNFDNVFSEFDYKPIGSASIAQVHKAKLKTGDEVAVKILRPNIRRIVARDIATLDLMARISNVFSQHYSKIFSDIAAVLKHARKSELDLTQEASNAVRLKEELRDLQGFYVPQVYFHVSSKNILVTEWIDGYALSDKKLIASLDFNRKQAAYNLVTSYFTQVYVYGFFHADMHQGNLFLMKNGLQEGAIGVVDFGIMGSIDKKMRLALAEIFIGFLQKDYERVAKIHVRAGLVPQDTNIDELALSCRKIGETIVGVSVKDISLAKLLSSLIVMTQEHKMVVKPELLLLQKTLLLVEGVGMMIDEHINIWELATPWMREWAKKNISFDAKIRDVVLEMVGMVKKIFSF